MQNPTASPPRGWPRLGGYARLMRLDRPIGTLLLLWPTLWGLWWAADGHPPQPVVLVFVAGVCVMRCAGCVINDLADRHIDPHVARTRNRPLACGAITVTEAWVLLALLLALATTLMMQLNALTMLWSGVAVTVALSYPFMKRFHPLPQAHLGLAFGFGIPMAFAAINNQVPALAWVLWAANGCWVVAYDTFYAMVDREDDRHLPVYSTALWFGRYDLFWIGCFQLWCLGLMALAGAMSHRGWVYGASLLVVSALFMYQHRLGAHRDREGCFHAFLHNQWVGCVVFVGLVLDQLPNTWS